MRRRSAFEARQEPVKGHMTAPELRSALKRLRLRQGAFAEILGKHRVTIGRWATGEAEVPQYAAAYLELAERCAVVGVWDLSEVA